MSYYYKKSTRRTVPPRPAASGGTDKTYENIRRECLSKGILYEDPEFPASDSSLFYSQIPTMKIEWKRPHEIADDPQIFVGGASRFDIKQGALGDCWLLAAIASLSLNKNMLYRIIPPEQNFKKGEYAGIFHFQFWQYGKWIDVVVDDLLPTHNGKLVYVHSADKNEFWSALLEKAYAKLNGSYEALKGGSTTEAMEDLTGGVTETIALEGAPKNLFNMMLKSLKKGALMGCTIEVWLFVTKGWQPCPDIYEHHRAHENITPTLYVGGIFLWVTPRVFVTQSTSQMEAKLSNGLLTGHAYSVTGLHTIRHMLRTGVKEELVRVRSPSGQVEWNGDWSDKSSKWRSISEEIKKRMAVEFDEDGEFWMSFSDFCRCFTKLEICNLGPDALEGDHVNSQWVTSLHEGRWVRGCTAGGCRNFPDTFWINPQYRIILEEEDDNPDDDINGCSFIVSLMQKNRRKQKAKGQGLLTIGFSIYRLKEILPENQTLKKDFFLYNQSTARSKNFTKQRENSQRFTLPPGEYVIIPSTFDPNEEADFVMRIYAEKRAKINEIDEVTKRIEKRTPVPVDEEATAMDKRFKQLFDQLAGKDGEIDAYELQDILNTVVKKSSHQTIGLDVEGCRSMVALMDVTKSCKLDYKEFKSLWVHVRKWISVFKQFDKDGSGSFDAYELRAALSDAGYRLSNALDQVLCARYANKALTINMEDFLLLSVRLEAMFNSFTKLFKGNNMKASLTLDEWLMTTMYT